MENQEKNKLSEWLDKIQQDSWQLELVVSAFSIFLLLGALDELEAMQMSLVLESEGLGDGQPLLQLVYAILLGSCFFLFINLVLHVVLRGLWISSIGLRSVSGDVDFDALKLSPLFDKLLRRKVGSFDRYVERLENLCSIVFAFTFLLVFMLISVGIWFGVAMLFAEAMAYVPASIRHTVALPIVIVFFTTSLLYLIDFLTLGFIKRIKWLSKFYLPIYRFYGVLTLSALYRPIYYNLIDNQFGRRAGYLLVPYMITTFYLATLTVESHIWYPQDTVDYGIDVRMYDDLRSEEDLIRSVAIPSKYLSNGYVELFVRYLPFDDDNTLTAKCKGFKPLQEVGMTSSITIGAKSVDPSFNPKSVAKSSFECLAGLYEVWVGDSLFSVSNFKFYTHPNQGEKGLLAILDVQYLPRGEHQVMVKKWLKSEYLTEQSQKDSMTLDTFAIVPFWKE